MHFGHCCDQLMALIPSRKSRLAKIQRNASQTYQYRRCLVLSLRQTRALTMSIFKY